MKFTNKLDIAAGVVAALLLVCLICLSCGKPPAPTPDVNLEFEVAKQTKIQGKLKPTVVMSVAEVKRMLQVAVESIDTE